MTKKEFYVRASSIILIAFAPWLCLFLCGYQKSYSSYWLTACQPIFILANILTAFYLNQQKDWKMSSVLLVGVIMFNTTDYRFIHDILALMFFVHCLLIMIRRVRSVPILLLFLSSIAFLPWSILAAEIIAITALCLYHLLILETYYHLTLENGKEKIKEN